MTLAELQKAAGPLWPDIDEALNDVRRDTAAQMQLAAQEAAAQLATERAAAAQNAAENLTAAATEIEARTAEQLAQLTDERDTALAAAAAEADRAETAQNNLAALKTEQGELVRLAAAAVGEGDLEKLALVLQRAQTPLQERQLAVLAAEKEKRRAEIEEIEQKEAAVRAGKLEPLASEPSPAPAETTP